MVRKNLDLIAAIAIALVNVIWTSLPFRFPVISTILALPLIFVVSGYVVVAVLFRKQASLTASHRLLLSLGLSIVIDVLGGLVLNLLPTGLHATSWAFLLGSLIVALSLIALYLRQRSEWHAVHLPNFRFPLYQYLLLVAAAAVIIFAIVYDTLGAVNQPYPGFTQLWMLPDTQNGKSCTVQLGVRNFEVTTMTYHITVTVQDTTVVIQSVVALSPQEEWNKTVTIPPVSVKDVHVVAQLYLADKPDVVYRNVDSTLYGCPTT